MPMPADPDFTVRTGERKADVAPPLPTAIVFPVPSTGATSGWKFAGNVPAKCGAVSQLLYPPGCHIQPIPGTIIQFPYR